MAFSATSLLILGLLAAAGSVASKDGTRWEPCSSLECTALGATLTQTTNLAADPCENFYEFACGNFAKRFRYDIDDPTGKPYTDASVHMTMEMENRLFEILVDENRFPLSDRTVQAATVLSATELSRAVFNNCINWGELKFSDQQSPESELGLQTTAARHFNSLLDHMVGDGEQLTSLEQLLARTSAMGFTTIFGLGITEDLINQLPSQPYAPLGPNATRLSITVNTFNYTSDTLLWHPMLKFLGSTNISLSDVLFGTETEPNPAKLKPNPKKVMTALARNLSQIIEPLQNSSVSFQGSIDELTFELSKNLTPPFNFSLFLSEMLPVQARVDQSAVVTVDNLPLLKALLSFFRAKPLYDTICSPNHRCKKRLTDRYAFLILDAMLELADLLPMSLKDTRTIKETPVATLTAAKPRRFRRQCLEATQKLMEPVVEWLYRQQFFPENISIVERVINETRDATIAGILEQAWITPADKVKMVEKVKAMRCYIGHREVTQTQLSEFYQDTVARFNRSRVGDLGHVLSLALQAHARRHLDLVTTNLQTLTPSAFLLESPFTVNAFNDLESNSLVFPLGILSPPVYSFGYPDFALYGGLASLAGHEIAHGFADQWLKSLGAGLLQLEPATEAAYMRLAGCVREEFAGIAVPPFRPLDVGNATLADDIADIIGLSSAFRAFQNASQSSSGPSRVARMCGLDRGTPEQLFFIHSAQVFCTKATPDALDELFRRDAAASHSPGPARVNGMARNSAEFARAFGCPLGSRMNPVKKCVFW